MRNPPELYRHTRTRPAMPKPGVLVSVTWVRHPPEGFGADPYAVGLIEQEDGTRLCAQLICEETPAIGTAVLPRMRRVRTLPSGLFVYDVKYAIASESAATVMQSQSYVLALTGPSGVGKTTVTRMLLSLLSAYTEQVPIYTTRTRKEGETEPYTYVASDVFERMVRRGEIIAHTRMSSLSERRRYGYRRKDIEAVWQKGKLPIVVTDVHLLEGLSQALGRRAILSCGLLPPGKSRRRMLSALLHRMRDRGRETDTQIRERLKVAETDLRAFHTHAHLFDHLFVNDELDRCVGAIREIVTVPLGPEGNVGRGGKRTFLRTAG